MKKFILMLIVLLGGGLLAACDTTNLPPDGDGDPIVVTGISLKDITGQGTVSDPFVFSANIGDTVSAEILVSPAQIVRDLDFTLVKKDGSNFVELTNTDTAGLEFNTNNSNTLFSAKALVAGTHYVKVSQGPISVYIEVTVAEAEVPVEPIDFEANLKVLAIGNSFSDDGMHYLYDIAADYGVDNIVLGNLYIGGAELSLHASNAESEAAAYTYRKNTSGSWQSTASKSILNGLLDEDWDIITIQQASGKSGRSEFYEPYLTELIEYINENKTNPDARIIWHMTWAYQSNSSHGEFPFYGSNQMTMYNAILSTYEDVVAIKDDIKGVIPAGTAIQNIRTSYIGDTVTHDGYHLNSGVGRFTAALTWFKAITSLSIDDITFKPSGVTEKDLDAIKEAVNNAVAKPLEVTQSTFTETEELDLTNHTLINEHLNFILGYWVSDSGHNLYTTAGNSVYFTTHDVRLSKENLPVGSVLKLEAGYQYRVNYFKTLSGSLVGNVRSSNLTTSEVVIDEAWWGDFEYVGINIAHAGGSTNISETFQDVAQKLSIYAAPGATLPADEEPQPEPDQSVFEIDFVIGYWYHTTHNINQSAGNHINFIASNQRFSKEELPVGTKLEIADGYQFRIVKFMNLDGDLSANIRTDNFKTTLILDEEFWGDFTHIGINISPVTTTDLTNIIDDVASKLVVTVPYFIQPDIPHVDQPFAFLSGYWFDNQTSMNPGVDTFSKGFAGSGPISKEFYSGYQSITLATGYQVRAVFFSYDNKGVYKVVYRTSNMTGTIVLDDAFWADYEYLGFNISSVPSSDLSGSLESLPGLFTLNPKPNFTHEDQPLFFVSGYWADGKSVITPGTDSFSKGFLASNVLSKEAMPANTLITVAAGYQIRVSFLTFSPDTGYKVMKRTANFTGDVVLSDELYEDYQYISINISAVPTRDLSEEAETAATTVLTFSIYEEETHVDEPLNFVMGYWYNGQTAVNTNSANSPQFIASNVLSKAYYALGTTVVIEEGYQFRVVFFSYENGIYTPLYRTDNITGSVVLDETLWGEYEYIGFNLSATPLRDISAEIETVSGMISFVAPEVVE